MNTFKDLNIPTLKRFTGEKISVKKLLNIEIKVTAFEILPSKKKEGTEYLTLQIELAGEKRVVFSGASGLKEQIRNVPKEKLPFLTTIKADNEYYEFT